MVDFWSHVGKAKMRLTTIQFLKICVHFCLFTKKFKYWSFHRGEYLALTACKLTQKMHSFDDDMVAYFKNNGHGSTCFQDELESGS